MAKIRAIVLMVFLIIPAVAHAAETEVYEIAAEGVYSMGDGETPQIAESRALANAKRNALEKAGTYVRSYSRMQKSDLTDDEIEVITSGIIKIEEKEKKRTLKDDVLIFQVKILATIKVDNVEDLKKMLKDRKELDDYRVIKREYEKLSAEMEVLKKQLSQSIDESEKVRLKAKVLEEERAFQSTEWLEKGRVYSTKGQLDEAVEAFTSAIALNTKNKWAYLFRSSIFVRKKQYNKALEDVNKVLSFDNDYKVLYSSRAAVYFSMGDYNKTIEDCTMAIRADPGQGFAYRWCGEAYYAKKDFDKAVDFFTKEISLEKNDPFTYTRRGEAYISKGQFDRALEDGNRVVSFRSDDFNGYSLRGAAYNGKGEYSKAIEELDKAIRIKPDESFSYMRRGFAYESLSRYDDSAADYGKAIALNPLNYDAYLSRGNLYLRQEKFDTALEDFNRAISMEPGNFIAYYPRAVAYTEKYLYDNAIADLKKVMQIKPDFMRADVLGSLGIAYKEAGRYAEAIESFEESVKLIPLPVTYYNLGETYELAGDKGLAMEQYRILARTDKSMATKLKNFIDGKKTLAGFWRTETGSLIRFEPRDDGGISAKMVAPSLASMQKGFKRGDVVFSGSVRGMTAEGKFTEKYGVESRCYPDGMPLVAKGDLSPDMNSMTVRLTYKIIDENCKESAVRTVEQTLVRETEPGRYIDKDEGFSIEFPVDWEKKEKIMGAKFVAIAPFASLQDQFQQFVVISSFPAPSMGLDDFFQLTIPDLKMKISSFEQIDSGSAVINNMDAKWLIFSRSENKLNLKSLFYMFIGKGRVYIIVCTAENDKFDAFNDKFQKIVQSFEFKN